MERFVYICNNQEFVKLIETFGENLNLQDNVNVFYYDTVYALKEAINIKKDVVQGVVQKLKTSFKWNSTDIIYVSVHPGSTSTEEIKTILNEINLQLNLNNKTQRSNVGEQQKIFVTYHGSQNLFANKLWSSEQINLSELNNSVRDFIKPNINEVIKKYKIEVLIDMELLENILNKNGNTNLNINIDIIKSIFEISDIKALKNYDIKDKLIKYYNALKDTNNAYNDFYGSIEKIKIKSDQKKK